MAQIKEWRFPGVFSDGERLLTKNLVPSHQVYGEELVLREKDEFRVWNPKRSKASAMLKKGAKHFPLHESSRILYLGAANGTTASHLSDISSKGMIYCVEFSKRAFRDLVYECELRKNMIPIFGDATKPGMYKGKPILTNAVQIGYGEYKAGRNDLRHAGRSYRE